MSFMDRLTEQSTEKRTENGAPTYSSSLNKNLDYFGLAGSMRSRSEDEIKSKFQDALAEHPETALRALVHLRNIRNGGLGERYAFRASTLGLLTNPSLAGATAELAPFVSDLGRWDDVVFLYRNADKKTKPAILEVIKAQLKQDILDKRENKSISLLAKWLPSVNTTNQEAHRAGKEIALALYDTDEDNDAFRRYRKTLSSLRKHIDVVERKMSANQWGHIDYEKVPSQASIRYRDAFHRHDPVRYEEYLEGLESGDKKVNASVTFPYEIVREYMFKHYNRDTLLEEAWKSLPDYTEGSDDRAIVVADTSGSMTMGDGLPMVTSVSLAIYCAERLQGEFANRYISFSGNPELNEVNPVASLKENVDKVMRTRWGHNTDINAVFDLILNTAVRGNVSQDEIPNKLIIISDMEFDSATGGGMFGRRASRTTNFQAAKEKFNRAGYDLPELVFWNVDARNDTVPVREGEEGTALVSGLSPSIFKTVLGKTITSPVEFMNDVLYQSKYDFVKPIAEKIQ